MLATSIYEGDLSGVGYCHMTEKCRVRHDKLLCSSPIALHAPPACNIRSLPRQLTPARRARPHFPSGFMNESVGEVGRREEVPRLVRNRPSTACSPRAHAALTRREGRGREREGECDVRVRSSTLVDDSPLSSICLASVPPPPCLPARLPGLPADGREDGRTDVCTTV